MGSASCALALKIAVDQIAQKIENNQKFARKPEVVGQTALEAKVAELQTKTWKQETLNGNQ